MQELGMFTCKSSRTNTKGHSGRDMATVKRRKTYFKRICASTPSMWGTLGCGPIINERFGMISMRTFPFGAILFNIRSLIVATKALSWKVSNEKPRQMMQSEPNTVDLK